MSDDVSDLDRYLDASPLNPTGAEAHGMLCGFLCGGRATPVDAWLDHLLPAVPSEDAAVREARRHLRDYAQPVENAIRGPDLAIRLPLVEDSAPVVVRATALYDWVRGFLYAMGAQGISERDLSPEGGEIYRDFAELTRMDLDTVDESEESQQALEEIVEFVRMAAMLIHDERSDGCDKIRGL